MYRRDHWAFRGVDASRPFVLRAASTRWALSESVPSLKVVFLSIYMTTHTHTHTHTHSDYAFDVKHIKRIPSIPSRRGAE